jgi:hypothetical protein
MPGWLSAFIQQSLRKIAYKPCIGGEMDAMRAGSSLPFALARRRFGTPAIVLYSDA